MANLASVKRQKLQATKPKENTMFVMRNLTAGQLNALVKKIGGEEVVRGVLDNSLIFRVEPAEPVKPKVLPFLRFIDTVDVPTIDRFEVDRIQIGEVDGVRVGYVDGFFTSCFGGLVEAAQPALALRRNELTRTASCSAINEALGEGVEEATMSQVWALMKRQGRGQRGKLHVDGKANLFRVRDAKGVLRLMNVFWRAVSGDWNVFAYEVGYGRDCYAGPHVFSRNS